MATETRSVDDGGAEQSLLVRAIWFVAVGWWATGIWLSIAWTLNVTILGAPLGIKMINQTPKVLSLKEPEHTTELTVNEDGEMEVADVEQRGLLVRGVYFVFVGWWLSAIWMSIAYLFTLSVVGIPVAVMMYNKLPAVVSLYRY